MDDVEDSEDSEDGFLSLVVSINRVLEAEEKRGHHYCPLLLVNTWSN